VYLNVGKPIEPQNVTADGLRETVIALQQRART
jgi:hypothetical protein